MDYNEALAKSRTVKWKASICHSGEECWCRIIEPVDKVEVEDDKGNDIYIAPSGSISKDHAEHIVKIHNDYIDRVSEGRL